MSEAYKNAGVDVEAGYRSVELIKEHVKRTNIPGVLSGICLYTHLTLPTICSV